MPGAAAEAAAAAWFDNSLFAELQLNCKENVEPVKRYLTTLIISGRKIPILGMTFLNLP